MKLQNNKNDLTDLISDESYQTWIAGKGDEELNQKWDKWLSKNPQNKELHNEAQSLWQSGSFVEHPIPDIQQELNVLQEKLNISQSAKKPDKSSTIIFPMKRRKFWKVSAAVISAAAILLIIFYLNINIFDNEYSTITTDFGERIKFDLSDGSTVILNANSTLRYPIDIGSEKVSNLYLKGEAFFNVTKRKNLNKNFIVETKHGLILVLGTKFVVNTRTNETNVSLISGRIKAMSKTDSDKQDYSSSVLMNPGDFISFKNNEKIMFPKKDILSLKTSWWKEQLILNQTSLNEIILRLKETYGIDVVIKDKRLLERTITGSIENTNLDLIIEAIGKVLQVPVQMRGNTVVFEKSNV